jgi:hypothetical protein
MGGEVPELRNRAGRECPASLPSPETFHKRKKEMEILFITLIGTMCGALLAAILIGITMIFD